MIRRLCSAALLSSLVAIGLSGCGESCTAIGCEYPSALDVRFDRALTSDDSFDLVVRPDDAPSSRWRCENRGCEVVEGTNAGRYVPGEGIRTNLEASMPASIEIIVESDGQSNATEHVLEYDVFYPNGESCGPRCETAVVDVVLPR